MSKHRLIPIVVDSEENVGVDGFRIDLKWKDPSNRSEGSPEVWSEYYWCTTADSKEEFRKLAEVTFDDFIIVDVHEIVMKDWGI